MLQVTPQAIRFFVTLVSFVTSGLVSYPRCLAENAAYVPGLRRSRYAT